ncbi:MAG: matrixin family metalloprotease [Acidobacteria bacterium]|nr:matrixin family metalloprotease [Acidobacteriota bacterium]
MKRQFIFLLSVFVFSTPVGAFVRMHTPGGEPLKLPSDKVQLTLSNQIAAAPNILPGGDPIAALDAARQEWNQFSTSSVFLQPFTNSSENLAKDDGINLITFSDDSPFVRDTDNLATTVINFSPLTGTVRDTDVAFNPNFKFFVTSSNQGFDLQSVVTHELGHTITADHSGVQSATMWASTEELGVVQRSLDWDDIAFAASTYPTATRPFGSVSGRVIVAGGSAFGAHVVVYDPDRNVVIGGMSLRDGTYRIDSVPPGNYIVYAEPFDRPMTTASLFGRGNGFFSSANTMFMTSSSGSRQAVALGQQVQNVDIAVPSSNVILNISRAGRNFVRPSNSATSFNLRPGPVLAGPGETFTLVVAGDGITADSVLARDFRLEIEGSGFRITDRGGDVFQSGTPFAFAQIAVAENAVPGPRQVKVTVGGQTSYYTAGFVIGERSVTQSVQRFGAVRQSAAEFTGIGITNLSDVAAVVRALFFDSSGELFAIPGMQNPAFLSVPSKGQIAQFSQEIFQAVQQENGWVELQADQGQVYSFFLSGDAGGTKLDGSDVPRSGMTNGIFTDVRQNSTFQTEIHMANGNSTPATVTFQFVGILGRKLGPVTRVLGPRSGLSETAGQLFGGVVSDGGYITFTSDKALNALELVRSNTTVVSLNAQDLSVGSSTLVSPHFAVGGAGLGFFSRLYLVNPAESIAQVQLEARDFKGSILGSKVFAMNPQEIVPVGIGETFGIVQTNSQITGSITIRALSGGPIFGSILVGDAAGSNFASELPLQGTANLGKDLLFEQLATAGGFFTGIAAYNANSTSAKITVEVYAPDGLLLGIFQKVLAPNEQLSRLITELLSGTANQAGGYIRVRSDQAVSAVVLFSHINGTVLSAVPASKVLP